MEPIIAIFKKEPFHDSAWTFELKYDGFRSIADPVNARMLSKNLNPVHRHQPLLLGLPTGCIFDGEIAALDDAGRPRFNALSGRRAEPVYVAFDVLWAMVRTCEVCRSGNGKRS